MLKIDWFSDLHLPSLDNPAWDMKASEQLEMRNFVMAGAVDYVQQTLQDMPDLIVNTGDNIDATPYELEDAALQDTICDIFNPLAHIMHTIKGNHDIRHADKLDLCGQFSFLNETKVITKPEATIILWDANVAPYFSDKKNPVTGQYDRTYKATRNDVKELYNILSKTSPALPVLLFSHIPLSTDAIENPVSIEERANPGRSYYQNNDAIHKILRSAQRSIFVFSGHRHYNGKKEERVTKGVRLFTIDRAVRWEELGPERLQGANNARIEVGDGWLTYNRRGAMPLTREFTF